MSDIGPWLSFVMAVLATWRITHLLVYEDGPADVIVRLRLRLGQGFIGALMDCFNCLSLWVAIPMALLVSRNPVELLVVWPALSGAACLLERAGRDPVIVQPISRDTELEEKHGMLWSEKGGRQERFDDDTEFPTSRHG